MDYIIEAVSFSGESGQQLLIAGLGLVKLGDLASDLLFIFTLIENWDKGLLELDDLGILDCAIAFTSIGLLFDLIKAIHLCCKKKCCWKGSDGQEDNVEEEKKFKTFEFSWRRYNLVFEEIPQFVILVVYFLKVSNFCDCFYDDDYRGDDDDSCCDRDVYNGAFIAAGTSACFTAFEIITTIVMCCKKQN
jgi:hypothetical protein